MFRKTAILIAILLWRATAMAEAQAPFRIAFPSFPPFHWAKEDGAMAGFFYEIVQEALEKRMGMMVVWTAYPWTRCQESLKAGTDDAIITVPTAERAAYTVTHQDPFYLKPLNLFTYAGHPRWPEIRKIQKIADLKKGGFSVITYSGNGWHKKTVEPLGIKTYETGYLENVWKMLAEKRGDTVIECGMAGDPASGGGRQSRGHLRHAFVDAVSSADPQRPSPEGPPGPSAGASRSSRC